MRKVKSPFSPFEFRNWGYWDGVAFRKRGRYPSEWANAAVHKPLHPTNKPYGEGFWAGWYGEAHPNDASVFPGSPRFTALGG
jgi:hypothetical protein